VSGGPDLAIGQQILDQALHPVGAVHREVDVGIGVGVEPPFVALGEQLRIAGHHAQGFLQIVGGDVGELLEVVVRSRELPGRSFEGFALSRGFLGRLARGDIDNGPLHGQGDTVAVTMQPAPRRYPADAGIAP
jgi:hypothetical protein